MKQRARELGALPHGLVRPGEIFEWPVKAKWADLVTEDEAEAAEKAKAVNAEAEAARPHESASGAAVRPGKSEPTQRGRGRPRGAATAET